MEEINIKICQNKTKAERIPKKLFQSKNINTKIFLFFFFIMLYKNETKGFTGW